MPAGQRNAVAAHRRGLKRRGIMRLEVRVREADAPLLRLVAAALADPAREAQTRAWLRERLEHPPAVGLKALLAAAPLEGIDLTRERDLGRPVDL